MTSTAESSEYDTVRTGKEDTYEEVRWWNGKRWYTTFIPKVEEVRPRGEIMTETAGTRIRRMRLVQGLSQREIAGPGCSYAYISRLEAGERTPSEKALRWLAAKLGTTAMHLENPKAGHCPHCGSQL